MKTKILSIATAIILLILILVLFLPLNFGFNTFYSLNREVKELRESVDLNVELAQKTNVEFTPPKNPLLSTNGS